MAEEQQRQQDLAQHLMAGTPRVFVVWIIAAINAAAYLVAGLIGAGWIDPDPGKMLTLGADYFALTMSGQYWRLLTSAFLHFGFIHLAANMYALVSVGPLAERLFGNVFFAVLYLFSAVLSGLASVWWDRHAVSAGASGAIFAVYGAVISFVLVHREAFPKTAARSILQGMAVFVGYNVLYGLSHKGISNSGHLGGLASGLLLGALMARPVDRARRGAQTNWRMALGVAVGSVAVAASLALMPASEVDLKAEYAFKAAREEMMAEEEKASELTRSMWALVKEDKLNDAQFSRRLDQEVVPLWDKMVSRLEGAAVGEKSPSRDLYDVLTAYTRARREAYSQLRDGLMTGDEAALKQYDVKMKQGDQLIEASKSAFQKAIPL